MNTFLSRNQNKLWVSSELSGLHFHPRVNVDVSGWINGRYSTGRDEMGFDWRDICWCEERRAVIGRSGTCFAIGCVCCAGVVAGGQQEAGRFGVTVLFSPHGYPLLRRHGDVTSCAAVGRQHCWETVRNDSCLFGTQRRRWEVKHRTNEWVVRRERDQTNDPHEENSLNNVFMRIIRHLWD